MQEGDACGQSRPFSGRSVSKDENVQADRSAKRRGGLARVLGAVRRARWPLKIGIGLAASLSGVVLRLALELGTFGHLPYQAFYPGVIAASILGGLLPGVAAAVAGACWGVLLAAPADPAPSLRLVLFLVNSFAISGLAEAMHRALWRLGEAEGQRAEAERLLVANERFRLTQASEAIAAFDLDIETNVARDADALRRMFGFQPGAVVNPDAVRSVALNDDVPKISAALDAAYDPGGDGAYAANYRIRRPSDGEERWITARGQVYFQGGRPVRMIGVCRDVTSEKAADHALRVSRAQDSPVRRAGADQRRDVRSRHGLSGGQPRLDRRLWPWLEIPGRPQPLRSASRYSGSLESGPSRGHERRIPHRRRRSLGRFRETGALDSLGRISLDGRGRRNRRRHPLRRGSYGAEAQRSRAAGKRGEVSQRLCGSGGRLRHGRCSRRDFRGEQGVLPADRLQRRRTEVDAAHRSASPRGQGRGQRADRGASWRRKPPLRRRKPLCPQGRRYHLGAQQRVPDARRRNRAPLDRLSRRGRDRAQTFRRDRCAHGGAAQRHSRRREGRGHFDRHRRRRSIHQRRLRADLRIRAATRWWEAMSGC